MEPYLIAALILLTYSQYRMIEKHKRTIRDQEKSLRSRDDAVLGQQKAIQQLRQYITQENHAKLEFHRMMARFPVAACAIQKIQCLEKEVTSLRRMLHSRHRSHLTREN